MRLLLDTCALRWFLRDDAEPSESAALAIKDPANEVVVCMASICENIQKGKFPGHNSPGFTATLRRSKPWR